MAGRRPRFFRWWLRLSRAATSWTSFRSAPGSFIKGGFARVFFRIDGAPARGDDPADSAGNSVATSHRGERAVGGEICFRDRVLRSLRVGRDRRADPPRRRSLHAIWAQPEFLRAHPRQRKLLRDESGWVAVEVRGPARSTIEAIPVIPRAAQAAAVVAKNSELKQAGAGRCRSTSRGRRVTPGSSDAIDGVFTAIGTWVTGHADGVFRRRLTDGRLDRAA